MDIKISRLELRHWEHVRDIYEQGIRQGDATFEVSAPDWDVWDSTHLTCCRLVAALDRRVIGWAALSPVSERCVYQGVAEVSVYVDQERQGQGIGKRLLQALIAESERAGIWTLQAGIFPENSASLALHRSCGFREVGRRERIGKMGDRWRDVILMERRSPVIK